MAGFDWDVFFAWIKDRLEQAASCTVGRYAAPPEGSSPYVDVALEEISGGDYDLEGMEGSRTPLIALTVYTSGESKDSSGYDVSCKARELMLSRGFHCRSGPVKVGSTDTDGACWVGRYQRVFGNGDEWTEEM